MGTKEPWKQNEFSMTKIGPCVIERRPSGIAFRSALYKNDNHMKRPREELRCNRALIWHADLPLVCISACGGTVNFLLERRVLCCGIRTSIVSIHHPRHSQLSAERRQRKSIVSITVMSLLVSSYYYYYIISKAGSSSSSIVLSIDNNIASTEKNQRSGH